MSVADVTTIATLNAQYGPQLQAAQNIPLTVAGALLQDPTNQQLQGQAVKAMTSAGVSPADAVAALQALAKIPADQLLLVSGSGQKVLDAQTALQNLAKVPPADLAFVSKYGSLAEPKVAGILTEVSHAAEESPKQWRNYYWIAVGGEVVFIPLIFLLAGPWSPKRARELEQEHEQMVEREMAKLQS